ncbi:MAG: SDR family oxidoreductase [Variibacter sp.]|nr:SDR family oxidoreductase [Variibacter sp.]
MPTRPHAQTRASAAPRRKGTALVTGGAARIGRAISLALARAGYGVVIHARRASEATETLAREIAALAVPAYVVLADLSDPESTAALIPTAVATAGPLSLLVNNASAFEADGVGELDPARWDRHFAVNLRAPVFLAQAFAAQLRDDEHGGQDASTAGSAGNASIVNITDQRAFKPVPRQFSYTLTKSALNAATVMLAQALAPRVRVNAVAPGPTLPSPRQDAAEFARQAAALPLGRGPRPEDIAAAVLYLAEAEAVTGVTIAVDGGQHIAWQTPDVADIRE